MKQRFQILNDPRFHLVYGVTQRFSYGPSPKLVRLNREGFTLVPGLKRKTPVYPGMLLGEHPAPDKGDLRLHPRRNQRNHGTQRVPGRHRPFQGRPRSGARGPARAGAGRR